MSEDTVDSLWQIRSQVGKWSVDPTLDEMSFDGQVVKLEPRTMRLLLYLMEHRDRVVSQKDLLDHVWANVIVTPQSVYSTIAQLRQALGDTVDAPSYIATVPKKGYRLVAPVNPIPVAEAPKSPIAPSPESPHVPSSRSTTPNLGLVRRNRWVIVSAAAVLGLLIMVYDREYRQLPPQTPPAVAASIAVLPFLDLSEKQDSAYLADGMTEELIDILVHNSALRVPARTSSFYFKGRTETVAVIARQLNVANLLEGSVRRSDNKIRVTAQLIRANDGFHLWSETYTRDGSDVLAVEDDIAQAVAKTLKARLTPATTPVSAGTPSSEAHNLLLECQFYRERNTIVDGEKSVRCFHDLINLDPTNSRAWADYADVLMRQPMITGAAPDDQRAGAMDAVEAARRALALNPNQAAAHGVIANFLRIFEHDWNGADQELKMAFAADPDDPTSLLAATGLARDLGHVDEFIALCERARINDPLNFQPYARLSEAYLYLGRLQDAETMARRRLDLAPNGNGGHMSLAEVLLARGQPQAALTELDHEPIELLRNLGYATAYQALGRTAEADSALNYVISHFADRQPTHIAEILVARGDTDRAFEFLEKATTVGDRNVLNIKINYYFRNLHADLRYQELLRRLSLPAG
jgi:TolB-like protein/DNA-binding winged helix-turn-helix (wHTH) protein/tetratricopeptide (TPR) repeat protein